VNVTEPFVLRQDVLLVPCAELSDDVRARISHEEGDFTLSRRHGRTLAQVIDAGTAALLELFRQPRTIVDAVIANSRALDKDPEAWLDELLPHLGAFVQNRVLIEAGSEEEQELRPQYDSGAEIGEWKIVRCASLIEDSEIYQLRDGDRVAALKIARISTPHMQALFDNEIDILRHIEGTGIAPRLLACALPCGGRPCSMYSISAALHQGWSRGSLRATIQNHTPIITPTAPYKYMTDCHCMLTISSAVSPP